MTNDISKVLEDSLSLDRVAYGRSMYDTWIRGIFIVPDTPSSFLILKPVVNYSPMTKMRLLSYKIFMELIYLMIFGFPVLRDRLLNTSMIKNLLVNWSSSNRELSFTRRFVADADLKFVFRTITGCSLPVPSTTSRSKIISRRFLSICDVRLAGVVKVGFLIRN